LDAPTAHTFQRKLASSDFRVSYQKTTFLPSVLKLTAMSFDLPKIVFTSDTEPQEKDTAF
jgi:hypothetical protein